MTSLEMEGGSGAVSTMATTTTSTKTSTIISNVSKPKSQSGIMGASSNLVNSIVGAGVIGIPFALKESGIVAGVILLVAVSYFTDKSLRLLIEMAYFHPRLKGKGVVTFEDLMLLAYGKWGRRYVLAAMLVTAYGAMVAYLLIVKDTVPLVLGLEDEAGEGSFMAREGIMVIFSVGIMLPLSMLRDMSTLAYTSFFSVICDTLLVVFVAFFSPVSESVKDAGGVGNVLQENWINSGFFIGFGVLTIAMTCQHSAFIVSGSLSNLTTQRWGKVTSSSLSISCILCAILGITGYLGFLDETQGDVLNNFDPDTIQATLARALLAITMLFTYPMEAFVARHVLMQLLFQGDMDGHTVDPQTGQVISKAPKMLFCLKRRHVWTIVLYITTLIPALLLDDLGPVLSFTGAIGGCSLAYIAPGLAYLGVHGEAFLEWAAQKCQPSTKTTGAAASTDTLPVEGNATAQMTTTNATLPSTFPSKPWWWVLCLMPFWCRIAQTGSQGMNDRLTEWGMSHHADLPASSFSADAAEEEKKRNNEGNLELTTTTATTGTTQADVLANASTLEVVPFVSRDAIISIFFIVFGILALVAGIISNIYASVNDILLSQ